MKKNNKLLLVVGIVVLLVLINKPDNTFIGTTAPLCTDTDGGINTKVKGTASISVASKTDLCIDGTKIREYYCEEKTYALTYKDVTGVGCKCSDGVLTGCVLGGDILGINSSYIIIGGIFLIILMFMLRRK